jgi:hypothetical protein
MSEATPKSTTGISTSRLLKAPLRATPRPLSRLALLGAALLGLSLGSAMTASADEIKPGIYRTPDRPV